MCGRLKQATGPDRFAELFGVGGPVPEIAATADLAPTQAILAVRRHPKTGARHLDRLRWGLVPHWARRMPDSPLFNARLEGIAGKRSFQDAWRASRRCLIPADLFYEWKREETAKLAHTVSCTDGAPLALGGLWENWRDPSDGAWRRSCTVITMAAEGALAEVHERMPLMIAPDGWRAWLEPGPVDPLSLRLGLDALTLAPLARGRDAA